MSLIIKANVLPHIDLNLLQLGLRFKMLFYSSRRVGAFGSLCVCLRL